MPGLQYTGREIRARKLRKIFTTEHTESTEKSKKHFTAENATSAEKIFAEKLTTEYKESTEKNFYNKSLWAL